MSQEPNMVDRERLPVAVVGAGPTGLAAAAELHARGLPFVVLERGAHAGGAVQAWGHVRMFSPWRYDVAPVARQLLDRAGWTAPDDDALPTGAEFHAGYLVPLASLPEIGPHVRYRAAVRAISRLGLDRTRTAGRADAPFVVRLVGGAEVLARAVLDASGTFDTPNPLGGNGLPAHGEASARAAGVVGDALPDVLGTDRDRYAGRHTIVVGSGHSAATTAHTLAGLATEAPGTTITWLIRARSADRAYGGGTDDALLARGALGLGLRTLVRSGRVTLVSDFHVTEVESTVDGVRLSGHAMDGRQVSASADHVVAATGYRPDHAHTGELRLDNDPALGAPRVLAPLIDPNEHSCGTVRPHGVDELGHPEPDFYTVGMKSYGRAPTYLMATGYEQVRSVVAALAGDWTAARTTRLELPATGVCTATVRVKAVTGAPDAQALLDRLGLARDVPARLLALSERYLAGGGTVPAAVLAAAADLGIPDDAAHQLADFAGRNFSL
jgi:thioredoxin reductase